MTRRERWLPWFLWVVAILGFISALCRCAPGNVPPDGRDNTSCRFEGYSETAVRGRLRTSFDFEGGECRVDCSGIPTDLICTVTPTITEY